MQITFISSDGASERPARPGERVNGFTELCAYYIPIPRGCEGCALLVDEEVLSKDVFVGRQCWCWQPGFYAGQVLAELRSPDGAVVATYVLDVSPSPGKLGHDHFAAMLDEVRKFQTGFLLGTEPARIAVGSGGGFRSLNIEYGRLRAYGRQLIRALHEVARRPLRRLRHRRDAVRLHQARRVDQQTLRTLARSAFAASLSPSADDSPAVEALLLDVPSVEETVDNAANRTLLYFLQALLSRVRLVRQELQREAERPDEATRTGLARRLPERMRYLNQLDSDLRRIARRAPFCHLSGAEISTAGLNAISASPCYGRAHRMAWWMLRHGIDASEAREQQWMIPTWEVFERWCFLVVMQQVASVLGVRVADWKTRIRYSKSGVGASVKATLCAAGYQTELCLQDTFPAWDVATAERASLSGLRCPDLTLSWTDPAGKHAWIVLDAKYRVSRPAVLDAMTSAHLYHDALRLHGERPVVSLLLTPAAPGAAWLATEEFIAQERVGVIDTSKPDTLARLLRAAIMGYDTTAW